MGRSYSFWRYFSFLFTNLNFLSRDGIFEFADFISIMFSQLLIDLISNRTAAYLTVHFSQIPWKGTQLPQRLIFEFKVVILSFGLLRNLANGIGSSRRRCNSNLLRFSWSGLYDLISSYICNLRFKPRIELLFLKCLRSDLLGLWQK